MTMSYKNSTGTVEEDDLLKKKPGEWQDPYEDKWSGYMKQYTNRKPFSYDINADALYDQYKDQYIQQGRMAMMDTMGQAAAMTGGYGNSYAQSVGQQAYNQQLNQLNNVIPDLYGMALDRYNQEGDDLLAKYNLYKGLSEESYYNHQTDLENWYKEYSAAFGGNESNPTKYADFGHDEQAKWDKDFQGATTYEQLIAIGDRMELAGIDPEAVAVIVLEYAIGKGLLPPVEPPKDGNGTTGNAGGGGGGVMNFAKR